MLSRSVQETFDRLAAPYDRGMAPLEVLWLRRMRARLLPRARGRVLEVGVGTGANFPLYESPVSLTAVDESSDMLAVAGRRAQAVGCSVRLLQMDVESLSFASGSFDTVVATLVLCSVMDQQRALGELQRVLRKPTGQLLLIEHMRPYRAPLAQLVDFLNLPWYALNHRCRLNHNTQEAVVRAGFRLEHAEATLSGLLRLIVASVG